MTSSPSPDARDDRPAARRLRGAAEGLLLALVAGSPWPLGSEPPRWEFVLSLGVLALAVIWAAHAVVTRRFAYQSDAISVCLLGLVLLTAVQLVPLPAPVVRFLSPTAADWHRTLVPETPELLPGEDEAAFPRRSEWVRLSVAPALTEDLLVRLLAVLVVYAAARNFVATDRSFSRLAWVGFAAGVALALFGTSQLLGGAGGASFGTFRNKNHFAFQVNLFAGLGIGLFLLAARRTGLSSPRALGLLAGLGLMFAAVTLSQSRGGLLAVAVAAVLTAAVARRARRAGFVLAGTGLLAFALVAAFGWRAFSDRVPKLRGGIDERVSGWRDTWPLVELFPFAGIGGGALPRAEPVVRTRPDLRVEFNTLDNDYLEALVEGGPVRLALTVGLAVAAVAVAAAGYRRHRTRETGPLLLGSVFGLGAVAVHSAGDYGLHIPSVALTAAVIAGHAAGVKRRDEAPTPDAAVTGAGAYLAAGMVVLVGLVVALAEWRSYRVDRLRTAAANAHGRDAAVRHLEAATRVRPDDPGPWTDLLAVHLHAAGERPSAALRVARVVRNLQPLHPGPHLVLGSYCESFARAEPPGVHLDRAKRVARFDPEVWFVCGQVAADRGDWPGALADWRESLARAPRRLEPIARRLSGRFPPERIRGEVLPDDPEVWHAAMPFLFPTATDPDRRAWLRTVADRWAAGPEPATPTRFAAWATALEELADVPAALRVWRRAAERFPDDIPTRDRLAARLEAEELYEEAVPVLEWLNARRPNSADLLDRLAAARHAVKLKADIDRP